MISPQVTDVSTVISILPIRMREDKPLIPASYNIPACKDVENSCETLMVMRAKFSVYIDESRPAIIIPEPSDNVANSICRDFKVSVSHYTPNESEPGLFWIRGGYTNQEALEAEELKEPLARARVMQLEWFKRLVSAGDDDWGRYHMRKMISDLQRIAAKSLKLEREWDIELEVGRHVGLKPCKFCRADIHPEAIICMHCHGVVDLDRFKKEFVSSAKVSESVKP